MMVLKDWIKNVFLIPLKRRITRFLFRVLVKLDRNFAERGGADSSSRSVEDQKPSIGQRGALVEAPALVVNDEGVLSTPQSVRMAVQALFGREGLSVGESAILEGVLGDPSCWASHDSFSAKIKNTLLESMARKNSRSAELVSSAEMLLQLERHAKLTADNRHAYGTDGKENPNAVFWPNPVHPKRPRTLHGEIPWARSIPILDRTTPVGSAGSCFAFEIAHYLQRKRFNYVITEHHANQENGFSNSCARWGTIFNTPSFKQLVERAFQVRTFPKILWSQKRDGKEVFMDPFREDILFDSIEHYESDQRIHVPLVREALLKSKVLVITLGVNEVWSLKASDAVFAVAPWRIAGHLVHPKVLSVEENLNELQRMLDILRHHNPEVELIVSVSPVPLHATFRGHEQHVIAANAHSKATLRVVAEEFCARNPGVHYFPSYEVVTQCAANPWEPDQRHVRREAVEQVMALFERMFVVTGSGDGAGP